MPRPSSNYISTSTQTFTDSSTSTGQDTFSFQEPQPQKTESICYEKSTQTEDTWEPSTNDAWVGNDEGIGRETREQNLEKLKEEWLKEKEEELQSKYQQPTVQDQESEQKPAIVAIRTLEGEELNAVVKSHDYKEFLDKSIKIADRALEEPYDILVDYSVDTGALDDDDDFGKGRTRKGRRVKQVAQFWDDKWSRKRIISDVGFSPKVSHLLNILLYSTNHHSTPN
jgi:dynein intermediate chain